MNAQERALEMAFEEIMDLRERLGAAAQERDRLRAALEKLQEETQRKYDEARQQQAACRKMDDDDGDSYHEGRADGFGHVLAALSSPSPTPQEPTT